MGNALTSAGDDFLLCGEFFVNANRCFRSRFRGISQSRVKKLCVLLKMMQGDVKQLNDKKTRTDEDFPSAMMQNTHFSRSLHAILTS